MMKKAALFMALMTSMLMFSCNNSKDTKEVKPDKPQAKIEIPDSFSMAGTWTADYKSQKLTIALNDDNKGVLSFGDADSKIEILKWEGEKLSENRINLGLYFYSDDKAKFKKGALHMYNAGYGTKLKMVYSGPNQFSVYNGVCLEGDQVVVDDGRMTLIRH